MIRRPAVYNTFNFDEDDDEDEFIIVNRRKDDISAVRFGTILIVFVVSLSAVALLKFQLIENTLATTIMDNLEVTKPNFVFIVVDDLSWNSMGYMPYDLTFATPTLTKLARSGVIMTNYYTYELCTPSRAALLTGRYATTLGMQYGELLPNQESGLGLDETLLPQVLQSNGYGTYAVGKWNLGHYTAEYLPTARGFDQFFGFLGAEEYYWSKYTTSIHKYILDFMQANATCYGMYNESDRADYSTKLYERKIVQYISDHNFASMPMFLYYGAQAVHEPYVDAYLSMYDQGIPRSYFTDALYEQVRANVVGRTRQEYALSLILLDQSVNNIVTALDAVGQLDSTYIIFTSDNGGCAGAGGQNGPLRGTKGSLFEGGTKVNTFVHGPLLGLTSTFTGASYTDLMHVSDWFPTILDLASIAYEAPQGHVLDGVNHGPAWRKLVASTLNSNATTMEVTNIRAFTHPNIEVVQPPARKYVFYNAYTNVRDGHFDVFSNANAAVRDNRYKLIHAYVDNKSARWYPYNSSAGAVLASTTNNDADVDDNIADTDVCHLYVAMEGNFTRMLFDLWEDPYETHNLYHNDSYNTIRDALTSVLKEYAATAKEQVIGTINLDTPAYWAAHGGYLQPFMPSGASTGSKSSHVVPKPC